MMNINSKEAIKFDDDNKSQQVVICTGVGNFAVPVQVTQDGIVIDCWIITWYELNLAILRILEEKNKEQRKMGNSCELDKCCGVAALPCVDAVQSPVLFIGAGLAFSF